MKIEIVKINRSQNPFLSREEQNRQEYAIEFSNIKRNGLDLGDERILLKFDSFEYDKILGDEKALTFLNIVAGVLQTEL